MRKILLILSTIPFFLNCNEKIEYYHGYVYESKNKPAVNFNIKTTKDKSSYNNSIKTDLKGYFIIKKPEMVNNYIYIYQQDSLIDSIQTRRSKGGEQIQFYYVNYRKDTIYLDTRRQ